jgi:N-acetylglucosaminyldiphosphoundecaprenol N-acetyl-beta-D-mannosaminyltransferase
MTSSSDPQTSEYPRGNILGVGVHAITMQEALRTMRSWVESAQPNYVCVTPAHAVMECLIDDQLRHVYNSCGLCTPDGMVIVWLLRLQGYKNVRRVYGPDLMLAACKNVLKVGYTHYFFGSSVETLKALTQALKERFPGISIVGSASPPFRPISADEEQTFLDDIVRSRPDFLWIGLGSPNQERWMAEHVRLLRVPVMVGVGAAFDFIAGVKPQAPRWVQKIGMEWLFRLVSEPRRLWKRYRQYPRFVWLALMQRLGLKKYTLE